MTTCIVIATNEGSYKKGEVKLAVNILEDTFFVISNATGQISNLCLFNNCAHLNFNDWEVVPTITYWQRKLQGE